MNKLNLLFAVALLASIPSLFAFGFTLENMTNKPVEVTVQYKLGKLKSFQLEPYNERSRYQKDGKWHWTNKHTDRLSCPTSFQFRALEAWGDIRGVTYSMTTAYEAPSCLKDYTLQLQWNKDAKKIEVMKKTK